MNEMMDSARNEHNATSTMYGIPMMISVDVVLLL
jgi:hypothetical protein